MWVNGVREKGSEARIEELDMEAVEEWSDGSRMEQGRRGGREYMYLVTMATVADAEEAGVALAWEQCDTVALDSQGVIQSIRDLMYHPWPPR